MDHQIAQNRRRAQVLARRASEMRSNLDKIRSRMSESGVEYVACSPEEALAMVRDDASSSSSTSSRVSDPSNAPELPTIRASAAHVAYAIDQGGCMEVIAIGLRTGTIEIHFPDTGRTPGWTSRTASATPTRPPTRSGRPAYRTRRPRRPTRARGSADSVCQCKYGACSIVVSVWRRELHRASSDLLLRVPLPIDSRGGGGDTVPQEKQASP